MSKKKSTNQPFILLSMIVTLLLVFILFVLPQGTDKRSRRTGTVDLSQLQTVSGKQINQEEFIDKNLVLTFTRSTCPHCDDQAFAFEGLKDSLDFVHYYIPVNEEYEVAKEHFDAIQVDYQLLIDPNFRLAKKLNIQSVPTTIIKRAGETEFEVVVGTIDVPKKKSDERPERLTMKELLKN